MDPPLRGRNVRANEQSRKENGNNTSSILCVLEDTYMADLELQRSLSDQGGSLYLREKIWTAFSDTVSALKGMLEFALKHKDRRASSKAHPSSNAGCVAEYLGKDIPACKYTQSYGTFGERKLACGCENKDEG